MDSVNILCEKCSHVQSMEASSATQNSRGVRITLGAALSVNFNNAKYNKLSNTVMIPECIYCPEAEED